MSEPFVRPARKTDAASMAPWLREADLKDCISGSPRECLERGFELGNCLTVVFEDLPVAMFGCSAHGSGMGSPWLLGTDEFVGPRCRRAVLKQFRQWLRLIAGGCSVLTNTIDQGNVVHIAFLRKLGATFLPTQNGRLSFTLFTGQL